MITFFFSLELFIVEQFPLNPHRENANQSQNHKPQEHHHNHTHKNDIQKKNRGNPH